MKENILQKDHLQNILERTDFYENEKVGKKKDEKKDRVSCCGDEKPFHNESKEREDEDEKESNDVTGSKNFSTQRSYDEDKNGGKKSVLWS